MLPFLKNKHEGSSSEPIESLDMSQDDAYDAMEAVAKDLLEAFQAHDVKGIAQILRAAFEIYESEPHVEGPHMGED